MVLWEKVDWKRKEKITEVRMANRMALLLLVSLIIPQFVDTIRLLISNHISWWNTPLSICYSTSILQQSIIQFIKNLHQSRSLTELWTAGYNSSTYEQKKEVRWWNAGTNITVFMTSDIPSKSVESIGFSAGIGWWCDYLYPCGYIQILPTNIVCKILSRIWIYWPG